jgi:C4-dicarboxylate-specific signal transduction histidine kinase
MMARCTPTEPRRSNGGAHYQASTRAREMNASIAHEVKQPLAAIATPWLGRQNSNLCISHLPELFRPNFP